MPFRNFNFINGATNNLAANNHFKSEQSLSDTEDSHAESFSTDLKTNLMNNHTNKYNDNDSKITSSTKLKNQPISQSSSKFHSDPSSLNELSKSNWHAPWKCYRVISGHLGWVRSIAFDHMNEWFCTGSSDRTIKIWDTSSGELKLTLTGHIEQVTGLALSQRQPFMFSCGLDKMVKCWDLEYNKVIRSYHGHLSGVYCIAIHPVLDLLFSGGRDSVCRVWDIRTKAQIHCLTGHSNTLGTLITQPVDPQVITGAQDGTIRFWDLRTGKTQQILTIHKKGVRALIKHPKESTFYSASVDNIKKLKLPCGKLISNISNQHRSIINTLTINKGGVLVSGGDNGSIWFFDSNDGRCFQQQQTVPQPGSLDSESGIFAATFDKTGTRLVTCEADKTIKMWKEDETATPETHEFIYNT